MGGLGDQAPGLVLEWLLLLGSGVHVARTFSLLLPVSMGSTIASMERSGLCRQSEHLQIASWLDLLTLSPVVLCSRCSRLLLCFLGLPLLVTWQLSSLLFLPSVTSAIVETLLTCLG